MDDAEKAAELEATNEVKEEEVRAKVIEEFGFDEVDDAERIEKAVAKEVEHSKKLSAAIGQKIKIRTERDELKSKIPTPPTEAPKAATEDVQAVIAKTLEQRDLESLDYPDDLKKEIQRIAQVQSVSIKAALRDPYIAHRIGEYEKDQKTDEAAISRTNRSGGSKNYSITNPPEVDMSTETGRKEWDAYIDWAKKQ